MKVRTGRRRSRWALAGVSSVLIAAGAVGLATESSARADNSPGQGSSAAQSLQVAPHDGSLSIGVTVGEAFAGHTGSFARAQSQGIDLGAIGTSLTTTNCGKTTLQPNQIPQPYETETGASGASAGETQTALKGGFGAVEHILANAVPYGEADTSIGSVASSALSVAGMATKTWSGLVNGQREAGATSDIGSISLFNGLVQLDGLHWESVYPSGGTAKPTGTFTLGGLTVDHVTVPLNLPIASLDTTINKVLSALGMQLELPVATLSGNIESVSPLELDVVPNTARDNIVDPIISKLGSLLNPIKTGLENGFGPWEPASLVTALCNTDTPFTVADVALASMTGAGFFSTSFGGVSSSSGALPPNSFSLGEHLGNVTLGGTSQLVGAGSATLGSGGTGATTGTPGTPAVAGTPGTPGTPITTSQSPASSAGSSQPTSQRVSPAAATGFKAGGPLLAVGLGGLGLLALLVEGDRRMMRRAQHTVNFEE